MVVLVEGIEIRNTVAARRDAPRTPSSLALFLRFPSITLLSILAASMCFPCSAPSTPSGFALSALDREARHWPPPRRGCVDPPPEEPRSTSDVPGQARDLAP